MTAQVVIGARMDALNLLEAEGHLKFDVGGCVGVVRKLFVVVETITFRAEAQGLVPLHTPFLPPIKPFVLRARLYEKLHLHLLKLAHTEDKLAGHDFVAKGFTDLRDAEGELHTSRLLHVQIVNKNALRRLRTQIDGRCALGGTANLGLKH